MSRDGLWVVVRTYRTLYFYPADALARSLAVEPGVVDLTPLAEIQGEAVAVANDGTIWLTSEAELGGDLPVLVRLQCPRRESNSHAGVPRAVKLRSKRLHR